MSNEKVILQFLDKKAGHTPKRDITFGVYIRRGCTLNSYGYKLINYETLLAYWKDNKVYLNIKKYSSTTSKIQNKLRELAKESGIDIVEFK